MASLTDAKPHKSYASIGIWILGFALVQVWLGCAKVGEEQARRFDDSLSRDTIRLVSHAPQEQQESSGSSQSPVQPAVYIEDDSDSPSQLNGKIATDINERVKGSATATVSYLGDWEDPKVVLFATGRQHGYIEPCGCTGLENAKGGLSRRHTLMKELEARGWPLVKVDVGNQVRRFGKQADIKFQRTVDVLTLMNYDAVCFGPDDLRLSLNGILQPVSTFEKFVCCNADLLELNKPYRVVEAGGKKIAITGLLGLEAKKIVKSGRSEDQVSETLTLSKIGEALSRTVPKMRAEKPDYMVLLCHATLKETRKVVELFPHDFDVVVTAGGAGEPTLEPDVVKGSKAQIIQVGTKGMYVGAVGFFDDKERPVRYGRLTLDKEFDDSSEVMEIFADYQKILEIQGMDGLDVKPQPHPRGTQFVGHEKCGECHTEAYEVFESSPHFHATESLVKPPNSRGAIARHFDPECLSCHVTGWNPQDYFPYKTGYLSISETHLHTNGCENCHGPGSEHVAIEEGDINVTDKRRDEVRASMRQTLEQAKNGGCYKCHDIDNSPEFDFDEYWPQIEHKGVD